MDEYPTKQGKLLPTDDTLLYRAILSNQGFAPDGKRVTDRVFRLRPNEKGLSVALELDQALDDLDYRGYTTILAGDVRGIGLEVCMKEGEDPTLYEIRGIPIDDEDAKLSYAIELAKRATEPVKMRRGR